MGNRLYKMFVDSNDYELTSTSDNTSDNKSKQISLPLGTKFTIKSVELVSSTNKDCVCKIDDTLQTIFMCVIAYQQLLDGPQPVIFWYDFTSYSFVNRYRIMVSCSSKHYMKDKHLILVDMKVTLINEIYATETLANMSKVFSDMAVYAESEPTINEFECCYRNGCLWVKE